MPELPELEVVREVLIRRVVGSTITDVSIVQPGGAVVMRDLSGLGWKQMLGGAQICSVERRGKFLVFALLPQGAQYPLVVINPKLTGRLQLAHPGEKRMAKTHLVLALSNNLELRYVDQRRMGQVYLTWDTSVVPDYAGMGPEPLVLSLDEFRSRLKGFRGEIKGILTRGAFVAGIGNAYADEILWAAGLYPFRKKAGLSASEIERLYAAMQGTLAHAIDQVRVEMGEEIHKKPRDFLNVHMRKGEPCPRCGSPISIISANQRITNFCRTCQPGGMIRGLGMGGLAR